jgi:hypothetical protein
MPLGSPAGPFCASTALPKLIAARSLPVGARSRSTSADTPACPNADSVPASRTAAAAVTSFMAFLLGVIPGRADGAISGIYNPGMAVMSAKTHLDSGAPFDRPE